MPPPTGALFVFSNYATGSHRSYLRVLADSIKNCHFLDALVLRLLDTPSNHLVDYCSFWFLTFRLNLQSISHLDKAIRPFARSKILAQFAFPHLRLLLCHLCGIPVGPRGRSRYIVSSAISSYNSRFSRDWQSILCSTRPSNYFRHVIEVMCHFWD